MKFRKEIDVVQEDIVSSPSAWYIRIFAKTDWNFYRKLPTWEEFVLWAGSQYGWIYHVLETEIIYVPYGKILFTSREPITDWIINIDWILQST